MKDSKADKSPRWAPVIVTGVPRVDYWRGSNWQRPDHPLWQLFDDAPKQKFQQYVMADFGDIRIGRGKQRHPVDRELWTHYIAESSGAVADATFGTVSLNKYTRMDVQVTLPLPHRTPREVFHQLSPGSAWTAGRVRGVRIIANHDHMDTCYIGSRTSDRVVRVYSKGSADNPLVRFEVEYKGKRAQTAAQALLSEEINRGDIVSGEIKMLPHVPALAPFHQWAEDRKAWTPKVEKGEPSAWWLWFERTAWPALVKALNDHDYGEDVAQEVYKLLHELDIPRVQD